jgi:hypothetical protein
MRRRGGAHAGEMPLDIGPSKALPRLFHGDNDAASRIGSVEYQLTAPNQRALLPVRVDPERIAANGDFLCWIARAHGKYARMKPGQTRDETWLLGMEVFHHDAFVVA